MAKSNIIETNITRFDGGVSRDIRDETSNGFSITKNFDIFSNPIVESVTIYKTEEFLIRN